MANHRQSSVGSEKKEKKKKTKKKPPQHSRYKFIYCTKLMTILIVIVHQYLVKTPPAAVAALILDNKNYETVHKVIQYDFSMNTIIHRKKNRTII